jgi:hypothetical protein
MIHFLDALNEQATWSDIEDARKWGATVLSQNLVDCNDELMDLNSDLQFIRQQLSRLHFQERLDVEQLDERLSTIQLCFVVDDHLAGQGSKSGTSSGLPPLRSAVQGNSPDESVRCLRNTLLVQFAHFLSDALAAGTAVARCEGLYRKELSKNYENRAQLLASGSGEPFEERWRGELALLAGFAKETTRDLIRCEDFFVATKAAKFCSDACRFNTFQIKNRSATPTI